MTRIVLSVWIYVSSLVALVTTGVLISRVLAIYPQSHLSSFGPVVPAIATTHSTWLPSAPALLYGLAAASAGIWLYYWRSRHPRDHKTFAITLLASVNFFLALFCSMALLVAYFYLPKAANGA